MPPKSFKPTRTRKRRRHSREAAENGSPKDASDKKSRSVVADTNIETLVKSDKPAKRPAPESFNVDELSKMSFKKRKRFNKYIENKLKKEETAALLTRLGESSVDTSLLASAKNLGIVRESKKQRIQRALLQERAGINPEKSKATLYELRELPDVGALNSSSVGKESEDGHMPSARIIEPTISFGRSGIVRVGSQIGSGLNGGRVGKVPVTKRRRNKSFLELIPGKLPAVHLKEGRDTLDDESLDINFNDYEEWTGFPDSGHSTTGLVGAASAPHQTKMDGGGSEESDEGGSGDGASDQGRSDGEEEPSGVEGSKERTRLGQTAKASAFKDWAAAQRNATLGETDEGSVSNVEGSLRLKATTIHVPQNRKEQMTLSSGPFRLTAPRKAFHVVVDRPLEIQKARLKIPIVGEEQRVMEAIHNNDCVIICGETGSGKTTQIPQFLYEAGYGSKESETPGLIGITQPRRVAAVSMARRVGDELGEGGEELSSYQIRFDGTVGPKTAVKFMTDGVLLRELASDFLLRKYSIIIIDEAHERSINTDILIGVMSRVLHLRGQMAKEGPKLEPLKLVIMSATLRVSDFAESPTLFRTPPPVLRIDSRQHPVGPGLENPRTFAKIIEVTIHFSRRTAVDYIGEAFSKTLEKCARITLKKGILVFLTSQDEIKVLSRRLSSIFSGSNTSRNTPELPQVKVLADDVIVESEDVDLGGLGMLKIDEEVDEQLPNDDDLGEGMNATDIESPLHVLPLYSLLPTKEQLKVFDEPPAGTRLCVLATNIAETSLTIPGIRYVIDCGRSKERQYDKTTGVQSFEICWVSKASAAQRAGRAGRTHPGHCYRLYSSAIYESDFKQFSPPEILRTSIEGVVLQMKTMSIDNVANFPFPTPPSRDDLCKAERLLGYLRAFDAEGALTGLGRLMSLFPLSPRHAKILIVGQQHQCLPYVITIVAALSAGEVFIPEHLLNSRGAEKGDDTNRNVNTENKGSRPQNQRANIAFSVLDAESDALKLLSAVCAFDYERDPQKFCSQNFVNQKTMEEIRKLRQQITKVVMSNFPGVLSSFEAKLALPSSFQVKALKQILAAGFIDQIAIRADLLPNSPFKFGHVEKLRGMPYVTLFPSTNEKSGDLWDKAVYVHPTSVLYLRSPYPEYILYRMLSKSNRSSGKVYMHPLTVIKGSQLAALAAGTPLITYSKPLESRPPRILEGSGGNRRECWVIPRLGAGIGESGVGWPLPPLRITQRKDPHSQKWVNE